MKKKWVIIGLVLVLLLAAALGYYFLRPSAGPGPVDLDAIEQALSIEGKTHGVYEDFRIQTDPSDLSIHDGLDENWTHILLMGTDGKYSELNGGRSDSMIVASVNKKTREIKLTSLVRDMLITLPGGKSQQRINTANAFGGPNLAMKTVNELLELNISRYCSINFAGLIELIDLVDGLELTLTKGEAGVIGVGYSEEPQRLNGLQALTYARIRKLDNNFGRNERQRKVLEALLQKAIKMDSRQVLALVPEALKLISTNLSSAEVLSLLPIVLGNTTGVDMLSLPPDKAYHYEQKDSASVVVFNEEKTRAAFRDFIAGEEAPAEEEKKD